MIEIPAIILPIPVDWIIRKDLIPVVIKLQSEQEDLIQLQLVGVGVNFVFFYHKITQSHDDQIMQTLMDKVEKLKFVAHHKFFKNIKIYI